SWELTESHILPSLGRSVSQRPEPFWVDSLGFSSDLPVDRIFFEFSGSGAGLALLQEHPGKTERMAWRQAGGVGLMGGRLWPFFAVEPAATHPPSNNVTIDPPQSFSVSSRMCSLFCQPARCRR